MPNKIKKNKTYTIIGLMSGTSLDGLDICAVEFAKKEDCWSFNILKSETIKYTQKLKEKFKKCTQFSSFELIKFDHDLGELFGRLTKQFIKSHGLKIDYIASHGHTVFHQPQNGFTLQIGNGQELANITHTPVVFDFRSKDISLGGQGAPLVPIGDKLLFPEYNACINFGGIANISFEKDRKRVAYDICPFNMGLNFLANQLNLEYDESGNIAKKGKLIQSLYSDLNELEYYKSTFPKSLGIEWFNDSCLPLLDDNELSVEDRLHTFSHHIAEQVSNALEVIEGNKVLLSGGGVYNEFIVDLIKNKTNKSIVIPPKEIVDFKEALIFAFLGVLRVENKTNVLKSVTGASKNSVSGIIVTP